MKKENRGGARKGSGRPANNIETVIVSFRVPVKYKERLQIVIRNEIARLNATAPPG